MLLPGCTYFELLEEMEGYTWLYYTIHPVYTYRGRLLECSGLTHELAGASRQGALAKYVSGRQKDYCIRLFPMQRRSSELQATGNSRSVFE